MHILFLTDNFPPEVNAPASRTFEHCKEWVKTGAKVTVVTCAPNFPTGKLFAGYKNRPWQSEDIEGIEVIRVWSYITSNEGFVRRTLDYLSFMLTASFSSLFVRNVDVIIGTSPQFFTVCAAWFLSKCKRVPWIFELRDMWPESIVTVGAMKDSIVIRLFEKLEMFLYRQASHIVVVTNAFRVTLVKRGIDEGKISVITNGVELSKFRYQEKDDALIRSLGLAGNFVAGYIGTHGMAHGLDTILDAAELLRSGPEAQCIKIVFIGDGAAKANLIKSAKARSLENVLFIDSVGKSEITRYWSILDVSIIHLKKKALFETVIPSKIFESMGMGIPLAHGVPGESADIVREAGAGELFASEQPKDLLAVLINMSRDRDRLQVYRDNCLNAAKQYDRKNLAKKMLSVVEMLVSKK